MSGPCIGLLDHCTARFEWPLHWFTGSQYGPLGVASVYKFSVASLYGLLRVAIAHVDFVSVRLV